MAGKGAKDNRTPNWEMRREAYDRIFNKSTKEDPDKKTTKNNKSKYEK